MSVQNARALEVVKRYYGAGFPQGHTVLLGLIRHACEEAATEERQRLLNTPEMRDFVAGVQLEAQHQVERWGAAHDRGKSAENWYWLIGYLSGKALRAAITGDRKKALHHCISSAAALLNWHAAIKADTTGSGKGDDRDLQEIARFENGSPA